MRFFKVLILVVFFLSFHAEADNDRAFFWQVESDNSTVYLLGSIHFADESFYPLRKKILDAFSSANNLVVELDIRKIDVDTYNNIISKTGYFKNGETLDTHLSKTTLHALKQALADYGIPYEHIKRQKPGVVVLTLTALQAMRLGLDSEKGIDYYFLAHATNKKIIALETLEQQLDIFLSVPDGELLLKESLHSLQEADEVMQEMVTSWKSGDEKKMQQLVFDDAIRDNPAFRVIYDRLFFDRNRQMMKKIEALLSQPQTSFVVVGAGHLIGDEGILDLLRQKGYRLTRQ